MLVAGDHVRMCPRGVHLLLSRDQPQRASFRWRSRHRKDRVDAPAALLAAADRFWRTRSGLSTEASLPPPPPSDEPPPAAVAICELDADGGCGPGFTAGAAPALPAARKVMPAQSRELFLIVSAPPTPSTRSLLFDSSK